MESRLSADPCYICLSAILVKSFRTNILSAIWRSYAIKGKIAFVPDPSLAAMLIRVTNPEHRRYCNEAVWVQHFHLVLAGIHSIMVKPKVTKVGPSTPAIHVTWKTVRSGGQYRDKIVKVPPRKKARIARENNESPSKAGVSTMEHPSLCGQEAWESYPDMNDVPMQGFKLPRNQVWHMSLLCAHFSYNNRTTTSTNGSNTRINTYLCFLT